MLVMRAYRHKLLFTPEQEGQASRFAGCARLIYNSGLQQRIMGYEIYKRGISYTKHTDYLPEAKQAEGFEFLQEAPLSRATAILAKSRQGFPELLPGACCLSYFQEAWPGR